LDLLAFSPTANADGWNIPGIRLCSHDDASSFDAEAMRGVTVCPHVLYGAQQYMRARYLEDWLLYHHLIGVKRIFLYDVDGTLESIELVRRYVKSGFVRYFPRWYDRFGARFLDAVGVGKMPYVLEQPTYQHCLHANRGGSMASEWILLLHSYDEYLGPMHHVEELLKPLRPVWPDVAFVSLPWFDFGVARKRDFRLGRLATVPDRFVDRAESLYEQCPDSGDCIDSAYGPRRYQSWWGSPLVNPQNVFEVVSAHWARPRPLTAVIDGAPRGAGVYHYHSVMKPMGCGAWCLKVRDTRMVWSVRWLRRETP